VRVWRTDARREDGIPQDRWVLTLRPVGSETPIVYPTTGSSRW
jgi:hypothetical protein